MPVFRLHFFKKQGAHIGKPPKYAFFNYVYPGFLPKCQKGVKSWVKTPILRGTSVFLKKNHKSQEDTAEPIKCNLPPISYVIWPRVL